MSKDKKKKTTEPEKATLVRIFLFTIQCIISVALVALIFKLGVLPTKYVVMLVVLLAALLAGTFFLMTPPKFATSKGKNGRHGKEELEIHNEIAKDYLPKKGKIRYIIGCVVSALISIVLLVGVKYAWEGDAALRTIVGSNIETRETYVVVLKDSEYKKTSELTGKPVAMDPDDEPDIMGEDKKTLDKEVKDIDYKEIKGSEALAEALYNGDVDAIFISDATYAIIEAKRETFPDDTRIITTQKTEIKKESIAKDVKNITTTPFSFYITGIDTYGRLSAVARSDVNMIVTVNPKTKQILMSSIPRDYFITLASFGVKDKLTHSGLKGPENTVKSVENFLGIDINYYVRVNFSSVISVVDALDGITVDNPMAFYADPYYFQAGKINMDGAMALRFARERYNVSGGDNGRVKNQERVVAGMINKLLSPAILTNYTSFMDSIDDSVQTNMKASEISALVKMQLDDMAGWTIVQKQFTGYGSMQYGGAYYPNEKLYYMIPNEDSVAENKQLILDVLAGKPVQ